MSSKFLCLRTNQFHSASSYMLLVLGINYSVACLLPLDILHADNSINPNYLTFKWLFSFMALACQDLLNCQAWWHMAVI